MQIYSLLTRKIKAIALVALLLLLGEGVKGQVITNGGSGLAITYTSLADAITDLNLATISSPVVIELTGNETAPAGGYQITAQGTAANTITIQGSASTITAAQQIAGSRNDAVFKLVGGDYITIKNFTIQENILNTITGLATNTMTEWGIALLVNSATNGSQHNTIQNNTISLNNLYVNSVGIYSNVLHLASATPQTFSDISGSSGSNSYNKLYNNTLSSISCPIIIVGSTNPLYMDEGNEAGGSLAGSGNTISGWGNNLPNAIAPPHIAATIFGIYCNNQKALDVVNNSLSSINFSTANALNGILVRYTGGSPAGSFAHDISNNTITLSNLGSSTFEVIKTEQMGSLATATININNNTILNCSSYGGFHGILNTSSPGTLNINSNTIRNTTSNATNQPVYGIRNTGTTISNYISLSNNDLGNASGNFIQLPGSYTGALYGISNEGGSTTSDLAISDNNFQGIVLGVGCTSPVTLINNLASSNTLNQAINNNIFNNLNINSSGNLSFIYSNAAIPAGGSQVISSNTIQTAFTKASGGTVYLYYSNASSDATGIITHTTNNFSNITLTGATTMGGWYNNVANATSKTFTTNTFSNWTIGSGTATVMELNGGTNMISSNSISNITGAGAVTAIKTNNSGSAILTQNSIGTLQSTGASLVNGILTSTPVATLYRNKVYNISNSNAAGSVNGLSVTDGTTVTIYNNLIGDLRAPAANATNPLNGLNLNGLAGTTINVYSNTIFLTGTSTGTDFGSSAVFANTTPTVNLRNNIFVNTSVQKGSGLTVVYRRSGTTLTTYAGTSNNNLFYAGIPSATALIYFDGTNSDMTLANYLARVAPRDALSISENPNFISTNGTSSDFLHISSACASVATAIESGGAIISPPVTTDYDGNLRFGEAGYTGNGTAPDIGADEFNPLTVVVTATAGTPGPSNYTTLRGAFAKINDGTHRGNITIQLHCNTTETATAVLYASGTGSSNYTKVNVYPVVSGLSINCSLSSGSANLIDLNGADNVTIDGRVNKTGTANLNIIHTGTDNSSRNIRFINSAQYDTVKYCILKGACPSNGSGIVYFSNSTSGTGNRYNSLEYCELTNSGTRPLNAVCSNASTPIPPNSFNRIYQNLFYNFLNPQYASNGILISANSTDWVISGNSFFETASFIPTANVNYTAIKISNTTDNNYTIEGNYIGGSGALCAGSAWTKTTRNNGFTGIHFDASASTTSSIQGNTIRNFNWTNTATSDWNGIYIVNGAVNIGNITGNTIGSSSGTGSVIVSNSGAVTGNLCGIKHMSNGASNIRNNTIGSLTTISTNTNPFHIYGIIKNGGTGVVTIINNVIGSLNTPASLNASSGTTANTQEVCGISNSATANITISQNIISNLSNSYAGASTGNVTGIYHSVGTGTNTISQNYIFNLYAPSTSPHVFGIRINGGSGTFSNNIITLGNTVTAGCNIYGIYDNSSNTRNIYFNTVSINGNVAAGGNYTYALFSNTNTATRNYRNNILANTRSGGGGTHYAISVPGNTGLTIDYNNYYVTGGVLGHFNLTNPTNLTDWRTATGQDVNSYESDPAFLVPGSTVANDYKPGNPQNGVTIAGITIDYNGALRATPIVGALEGATIVTNSLSPASVCTGGTLDVGFVSSGTFVAGNTYKAQLSDFTGSFSTPTDFLPTLVSSLSGPGTISGVQIPITTPTPAGANYKIRVISSTPAITNDPGMSVTINPTPVIPDQSVTVCSGSPISFTPVNNLPGTIVPAGTTYTWTVPVVTGGITGGNAQAVPQPSVNQTLTNPSNLLEFATYQVTPATATCTGATFQFSVSVQPSPILTSATSLPGMCSAAEFNYTPTSSTPGVSFSWAIVPAAGISASVVSGTNSITSTLTNQTLNTINVSFIYTLDIPGCSSTQTITVPVTPVPTLVTTIPSPGTICSGQTFSFSPATTISEPTTYNWSRAAIAGISQGASSGTGGISEILTNTTTNPIAVTYSYILSSNGCSSPVPESVTVIVIPIPVVTANASPANVCFGETFDLTSGSNIGSSLSDEIFSANFETVPDNWDISINSGGNLTIWTRVASPHTTRAVLLPFVNVTINSNTNDHFYLADNTPGLGDVETYLASPAPGMSTIGYTSLILDFWQYYRDKGIGAPFNDNAYIDVSTDNGASWTQVKMYDLTQGLPYDFSHETVNLSTYIGLPSLRIRFRFHPTGDYYWAIDNVRVTGSSPALDFSWTASPAAAGFPNTLNPNLFGITQTGTTTYTATYTDANVGCPGSASVTVTNYPAPVVPTVTASGPLTFCAGGSVTLTSSLANTYQWNQNGSPLPGQTAQSFVATFGTNYSVTTTSTDGCSATSALVSTTVNPLPTITGITTVCTGSTTQLTGSGTAAASNPWVSLDNTIATVSGTGLVTGISAGTATITYTNNNNCSQTATITVNATPTTSLIWHQ